MSFHLIFLGGQPASHGRELLLGERHLDATPLARYLDEARRVAQYSLAWLGKLDAGSLKIKVAASIVAISSIHLLKAFMNVSVVSN